MVVKTLNMVNNCQNLGPVAQLGQSVGLLIHWSRDRSPPGPFFFTNYLFSSNCESM